VLPLTLIVLFPGSGSTAGISGSRTLITVISKALTPGDTQVTIQLRLRNVLVPDGMTEFWTVITPDVAEQSEGSVGVNVVSTIAGETGPLLRTNVCAVNCKGTPASASTGARSVTVTTSTSAFGTGVGVGVGSGVAVASGVGSGLGEGVGSGAAVGSGVEVTSGVGIGVGSGVSEAVGSGEGVTAGVGVVSPGAGAPEVQPRSVCFSGACAEFSLA
jgi:hypothetical protein